MRWLFNLRTARDEFVDVADNADVPDGYEPMVPVGRRPRITPPDSWTRDMTELEMIEAMRTPVRIGAPQAPTNSPAEWTAVDFDEAFAETATEQYIRTTVPVRPAATRMSAVDWERARQVFNADAVIMEGYRNIDGRAPKKRSRDEDTEMAVANKEPVPHALLPNPLGNISFYQVKYSLQLYKDILAAIRKAVLNSEHGKTMVPMCFDKPRPTPPKISASNRYSPKYDTKKPKSYATPFETWEFYDEWSNKVHPAELKNVPKHNRDIWETYRLALVAWEKTKGQVEEVPIQHVFRFLHNKLTSDWSTALDNAANTFNRQEREFWISRFTSYNKRAVSWAEIEECIKVVYHKSRWEDENYHRLARMMPLEVRPRRVTNFQGSYFRRYIIEYFQKLYRIKYGEEWPANTLFYNTWQEVVDLGAGGVIQVDNLSGLAGHIEKYTVPQRYADEHLVTTCICCSKLGDVGRMYWVSPKHKDQIEFRSIVNTEARKKKRQEEFLKNYKPEKLDAKYYNYPASVKDISKVPTHIHGIIRFLNDHIDSFDKNKKQVSGHGVDEYGINHVELDEKEMPFTHIKYLGAGWADTANRKRYVMVCQWCFSRIGKPPVSREEAEFIDARAPAPRRNPLRRDRDSVIMKYKANPFDYLGKTFMMAKGESRRMEQEKIYNPRTGTFTTREKDATLYFGVELEVCPEDDLYTKHMLGRCGFNVDEYGWTPLYNDVTWVAANVVDRFVKQKKSGIITFDRSTGNGFELVTLPGSYRWHMEEAWNGFFKEDYDDPEMAALAPAAFCSGWVNNGQPTKNKFLLNATTERGERITNRPYCGIHIHFSRDAITPLQLGKIKYFINTHTKFIEQIAGRTSEQYARYVPSKIKDGTAMAKTRSVNTTNLGGRDDRARYVALNLNTGKPTFEVRIFRSNVSKAGFFKNIDFVHALIVWCGTAAPVMEKQLTVAAFVNWMEGQRGQYKWLTKWLIHHKYMSSVHKFTLGRTREFDFIDDNIENETTTKMTRRA